MRGAFLRDTRGRQELRKRRGLHLVPNLLTTGNLFSGLASVILVLHERYEAAAIAVLIAMVFDTLDGTSARLMKSTSEFGLQYDSLADLISFGLAPGLIIYTWGLGFPEMLGAAVMFAYVACGALRLARFNVMGSSGDSRFFTGLPIPAAAGLIATLLIFDKHILKMSSEAKPGVVLVIALILSFLMVSTLKYRSLKQLQFQGHHHFMYLVWAVLILVSVIAYPQLMLFVVFAAYAVSGALEKGIMSVVKMFSRQAVPGGTSQTLTTPKE